MSEKLPKQFKHRSDGWQNIATGIGVKFKDKRMSGKMSFDGLLTEQETEDIYTADGQARRLVDILPQEATRQWLKFNSPDINEDQGDVHEDIKRLKIKAKVKESWVNARLCGGGVLFLNVGDQPADFNKPVDENNIKELISLVPFTRYELQVNSADICTNIMDPNFNMPDYYTLMTKGTVGIKANMFRIHHSRIVRFDGLYLPRLKSYGNQLWGSDVFTPIHEVLRDFGVSYGSIANIIQDFRIMVHKIDGLSEMVDSDDLEALKIRIEAMNLSRGITGAFLCDKDGEEVEYFSSSVAGLADLVDRMKARLQSAVDIPHTILFNESPSGLGATGRTEESQWFDYVKAQQETYLMPALDRIFKIMFLAKRGPTNGALPDNWSYKFTPLGQVTEKEQADIDKVKADTAHIYITDNVLSNDEVRHREFPDIEGDAPVPEPDPQPILPATLSAAGIVDPKNPGGTGDTPPAAGK